MAAIILPAIMVVPASAGIEWQAGKQIELDVKPLDVAVSADGQWLYILAAKEILIYSRMEDKATFRIPLEAEFDRIAYSPKDNALVLTNSETKALSLIQLEIVHEFDVSGQPFKGPENAPVLITVFSDYQ